MKGSTERLDSFLGRDGVSFTGVSLGLNGVAAYQLGNVGMNPTIL